MKIGFIGLGHMGSMMAGRLIAAGHQLIVYNRSAEKVKPLTAAGAEAASSPAETAASADVLITMLADDAAVASTVLGDAGAAAALGRGCIHVSMSTIGPAMALRLATVHERAGQRYVSAPVLGRPDAAERGELVILAAGPPAVIETCRPLFDVMGRETHVIGDEPHQANAVKLGANLLFAVVVEALGESAGLMESYGVDAARFFDIVNGSALKSPFVAAYGSRIAKRDFEPAGFRLELGAKDIRLVLEAAAQRSVDTPIADFLQQRFADAITAGLGKIDWSAVGRGRK